MSALGHRVINGTNLVPRGPSYCVARDQMIALKSGSGSNVIVGRAQDHVDYQHQSQSHSTTSKASVFIKLAHNVLKNE